MTENFSCMLKKRYTSAGARTMTEVHFELDDRLHVAAVMHPSGIFFTAQVCQQLNRHVCA